MKNTDTQPPAKNDQEVGKGPPLTRIVSPLQLQKLEIEINRWGENKGRYTAKVKYAGDKGEITINLSPDLSDDLMRFCGGSIKRFSEEATLELQASIQDSIECSKGSILGANTQNPGSDNLS